MKQMIRAAKLVASAGQATALSWLFGDSAVAVTQAQELGADFQAAIGTLAWDLPADQLHGGGLIMEYEGPERTTPARFTGDIISADGQRTPIDAAVFVETICINGDCGYAYTGFEMLTFLHEGDAGLVMDAYPCQSYPTGVSETTLATVQSCIEGGPCDGTLSWE